MAYGPVNVPGASADELDAVMQTAEAANTASQEVSDKIGATGNTGGSASAGTVMGKLNKLITDLTTHMGRWTAARATAIDTIKTDAAAAKSSTSVIGATGNTGGSATAGTVMGKLNKLITDLTTHTGRWTATRAGYIDTINTNAASAKTDAAAAKSNTAVNNTAASDGNLSQKLSYVIEQLANEGHKVKSIQKGRVLYNKVYESDLGGVTGVTGGNVDINISAVDSSKCVVLLYGPAFIAFKDGHAQNVYPSYQFDTGKLQLTTSVLSQAIPATSYASCYVTWHVIEFY